MKKIIVSLLALPMLLSAGDARAESNFGEYKVKIHVTNAEKMKVKWWCNESDDTTTLIDADTYPASTKTTRSTNITAAKCSTGDWKVSFEIKKGSNWRKVEPGAGVCHDDGSCGYTNDGWNFKTYARPVDFNSSGKLCTTSWNFGFYDIYVNKAGC